MKLTPPRLITFAVSILLIGLAVASLYLRIPTIGRFDGGAERGRNPPLNAEAASLCAPAVRNEDLRSALRCSLEP